jgi:hypothetical protein
MTRHFRHLSGAVLSLLLIAVASESNAQKAFANLPVATDSTYGYTNTNPVKLKKGNQEKSILQEMNYLSGLTTNDKQHLVFLHRTAVLNPGYKPPLITDRTAPKAGVLDKYVFLTADTKDTVTLFIDIYSKGTLMLPVGLTYELP